MATIGVITFPGTCDDIDARHAAAKVADVKPLWHRDTDLEGIDAVVCLEADPEVTAQRMAARALLEGRVDDTVDAIRVRLQVHADQTRPLLEVYEQLGLLRRVDGSGTVDEVAQRVFASVGSDRPESTPLA